MIIEQLYKFYRHRLLSQMTLVGAMLLAFAHAHAAGNTLKEITFSSLPGDQVQIRLAMEQPAAEPGSFTIDNPARIALDLPDTEIDISSRNISVGVGVARSISVVEAGGRARVVINLSKLSGYQTRVDGNEIIVTVGESNGQANKVAASSVNRKTNRSVRNIDFRRGDQGEGRIILNLADPNTAVDMKARGEQIIVTVNNSSIAANLERRLDVIDFGTPVKTIDSFNQSGDVRLVITARGKFDHIAYQTDETFTIDIKPIIVTAASEKKEKEFPYKGERLSLNFQDIEVRAVLQLIADFTDLNLITSDTVKGNVTLRLKNVPWDQALDIILRSRGLGMMKEGNVISVAPIEEIASRTKLEQTVEEQAPLVSESIQVNYAKASDLQKLLKTKDNNLLSERGSVGVDERTNKLLIRDTARNIDNIAALVNELDIPVKQVLIESRVVLATNDFSKELGIRFGVSSEDTSSSGNELLVTSGTHRSASSIREDITTGSPTIGLNYPDAYNVDLPVTNLAATAGRIGLAFAKLPFGTVLDLELSAAQAEGRSETISSPRVITSDQSKALIETGTEIPYQEASSSGATSVSFKKAVLKLEVTPQITPDDRVIMELKVSKDNPDFANVVLGVPPINTQNVETEVLVDNGETIVLGGVYEQTTSQQINRVPFFGDLPIVGVLFRDRFEQNDKSELLIFVTPKIIKESTKI